MRGDTDGAVGGTGEEDRRMRVRHRVREQLVIAIDLDAEVLAGVIGAAFVEKVDEQRQRLLLDIAATCEVDAKTVEFVFPVAGAKAQHEAAVAENVEEGG